MKITALLLVTLGITSSALALPGHRSRSMSCDELQSIVQRDGEITILHRIGSMTYYANESRCSEFPYRAIARQGYEPSSDQNRCFVGWRCDFVGDSDVK
jgi:hypothetical protein